MNYRSCLAALVAFTSSFAMADKSVELTVAGYASGRAALEGFPFLVRISPQSIDGFDYNAIAQDFSNLVFEDSVGRELPYDVDTWDPTGESLVWVRALSLEQGSTFYMRYGVGQSRTLPSTAVWTGYVGVWHFSEQIDSTIAATTASADSTANGIDLSPRTGDWDGEFNLGPDTSLMVSESGAVGSARYNGDSMVRRQGLTSASGDAFNAAGSTFTFSGWFYIHGTQFDRCERLVSRDASCWEWTTGWNQANKLDVNTSGPAQEYTLPSSLLDGWAYLTVAYDDATATVYHNGVPLGSHAITPVGTSANPLVLGLKPAGNDSALSGAYDEVRFDDAVRTADWAYADYQTQANASFLTYGDAEDYSQAVAQVTPVVRTVSNASEQGLRQGRFSVTIAEPVSWPIQVMYAISGNAVAGTDYEPLPGYVTIPAGETSAQVVVTPRMNRAVRTNTRIVLAIAEGSYLSSNSSATMLIENFDPPISTMELTVSGYPSERPAIPNFPVLVRLSTAITGFRYSLLNPDGSDIYFTDETDTVVYPCEIDTWDRNGESLVWVRLPLMGNGTKFHCHFGERNDLTDGSAGTWSDYVGVWHFGEDDGVAYDSTVNHLDASPVAAGAASTANMVAFQAGAVGRARVNTPTIIDYWGHGDAAYLLAPYAPVMDMGNKFMVSGWWRAESFLGCSRPVSHKDDWSGLGWEVTLQYEGDDGTTQTLYPRGAGGTTHNYGNVYPVMNQQWCHLAFVYNWAQLSVYINGELSLTANIDNNNNYAYDSCGLAFGCMANGRDQSFIGEYDEIRLRATPDRAGEAAGNEIWAEYRTVVDADFLSYGDVETIGIPATLIMLR